MRLHTGVVCNGITCSAGIRVSLKEQNVGRRHEVCPLKLRTNPQICSQFKLGGSRCSRPCAAQDRGSPVAESLVAFRVA